MRLPRVRGILLWSHSRNFLSQRRAVGRLTGLIVEKIVERSVLCRYLSICDQLGVFVRHILDPHHAAIRLLRRHHATASVRCPIGAAAGFTVISMS